MGCGQMVVDMSDEPEYEDDDEAGAVVGPSDADIAFVAAHIDLKSSTVYLIFKDGKCSRTALNWHKVLLSDKKARVAFFSGTGPVMRLIAKGDKTTDEAEKRRDVELGDIIETCLRHEVETGRGF